MLKLRFTALTLLLAATMQAQTNNDLDVQPFAESANNKGSQILDVRTASEYRSGHIKNALQADWNDQKQFADRAQYLDKNKPIYVYCLSGARSSSAAQWLRKNGYIQVYHLKGGLMSWKKSGQPIEGGTTVKQMTIPEYQAATVSHKVVLVDFGAEWCPPCKKMEPILAALQAEMGSKFKLVKVDGGNDTDVIREKGVEALPVFIIYKNGKEVWRKNGIVSKQELEQQLTN